MIFDFSRVFIFPKDQAYFGGLNDLHRVLSESPNYNFSDNFEFNQELLEFILENQLQRRFNLYIFTSGVIQNAIPCQRFLNGYFKECFSGDKLKLKKNTPSSYLILAEKIGIEPKHILYIDDVRENTVAAETAGLPTITFRNNMQFEAEISSYI